MSGTESNKKNIENNRKTILKIDTSVMSNKASIYQSRSMIEENRLMILSNYAAAFMGNRQLANHNTDELFENRKAILSSVECGTDVEVNYVQASINKSSLDFLEHRSAMNAAVLDVSEELANINTQLIAINTKIMDANQGIVDFNAEQIAVNVSLLDGDLKPSNATVDGNAALIAANAVAMQEIASNASRNGDRMKSLLSSSAENSASLMDNKAVINQRRESILNNRDDILANRQRVSG